MIYKMTTAEALAYLKGLCGHGWAIYVGYFWDEIMECGYIDAQDLREKWLRAIERTRLHELFANFARDF